MQTRGWGNLRLGRAELPWLAPALIVVLTAVLRAISFLPDDVSWLTTLAEKTWQGERPYIDFFDTDLPLGFLVYLPPALIGSWSGIGAEPAVNILTILAACASVWFSLRLFLRHGLDERERCGAFAAVALAALLVLPGNTFAQREHIASIALLPLLSVYAVRAFGRDPGLVVSAVAGAGAALAIAIKPYLVLPVALPFLYLLFLRRDAALRIIFSAENIIMGALLVLYALAIVVFFPAFIDLVLPVNLIVYGPSRMSPLRIVRNESTIATLIAAVAMLLAVRGETGKPSHIVAGLAAVGFATAYFIQAKCFPYHAYPAIALFLLAAGIALLGKLQGMRRSLPGQRRNILLAATMFCVAAAVSLHDFDLPLAYPKLFFAARAVAPAHPKVVSITGPMIGPQIARYLDGKWASRAPSQFLTRRAQGLLQSAELPAARRRQIEAYMRLDRDMLVESLRTQHPDLLVSDTEGIRWASSQPSIAGELRHYRKAAAEGDYTLWVRR
jgi:hypothetical protein